MRKLSANEHFKQASRYILAAVVVSIVVFVLYHLRSPVLSRSISPLVLWRAGDPQHLEKVRHDDYVDFDQYVPKPFDKVMTLIKRVGCGPGENLRVDSNDYYYCNGVYLAQAKREVAGKPIVPFRFNGVVPAGKLFVVGDVAGSFDSRVYGFIDRIRLKGVLWPLL